jgi:Na+-driven multidrug efflux pump
MIIMLSTFVGVRQVYLYIVTRFVANTPRIVGFGYPVGWVCCCALELFYFAHHRHVRLQKEAQPSAGA